MFFFSCLADGTLCEGSSRTLCHNGGTCTVTNERHSFYICPVGYYGFNCEKQKSMCPLLNNSLLLDRQHQGLDTFDRSITSWFCKAEFIPRQGFTVCQFDTWSANVTCKEYISDYLNPGVKKFFYRFNHVNLALLIVICLGQMTWPCLIYCLLSACRRVCFNRKDFNQTTRKEQIIAHFKEELATFENRHPITISPHFAYSNNANAELADIQKRLEKAVDKQKTKQKNSKRRGKQTTDGSKRVASGYSSFTFWFWVAYLTVSWWYNLASYEPRFYIFNYIAVVMLGCLAFLTSWCSMKVMHRLIANILIIWHQFCQ